MEQVTPTQAWGVSSGVPGNTVVVLKDGWLPLERTTDWQINSVGWVDGAGREWWAEDDTGSVLLGMLKDWTGPAEMATGKLYGRIEFDRPLDSRAHVLRVVPMTMTERAVVTVTLP